MSGVESSVVEDMANYTTYGARLACLLYVTHMISE